MLGSSRVCAAISAVLTLVLSQVALSAEPKNIIICIGDGMGPEQVKAGRYYNGGYLSFETLPFQGWQTTYSANNAITESAASATSIATGVKVDNYTISTAYPGDGSDLPTVLEYYRDRGRSTGLVTTTFMTEFTPGAFGAHTRYRVNLFDIADDYLYDTRPNVLFGGGGQGLYPWNAGAAGYTVVTNAAEMYALDADTETYVSGQFGTSHMPFELDGVGDLPHLSEMTEVALDILDKDPDGFFLMMEGGRIDHGGHLNSIEVNVTETQEFSNSVQVILDWAASRTDTIVIVTADHETGDLTVDADNGEGNYPSVTWGSDDHTGIDMPIYAWGLNARNVTGTIDNTDIYDLMVMDEVADFDEDGDVDLADIDTLCDNMGGEPGAFDLNGDGIVDKDDLDYMLSEVLCSALGDFNLNRLVDGTDLSILAANFGAAAGYDGGDTNGDNTIDGTDLSILSSTFGFAQTAAIPEPIAVSLLGVGGLGLLRRRRRRSCVAGH